MYSNMYSVCHIAGELLKELDGGVHTDTDILCVQIAALSHDLGECLIETIATLQVLCFINNSGHGPFSHVYDTLVEEYCLEADIQLTERQKKLMKVIVIVSLITSNKVFLLIILL